MLRPTIKLPSTKAQVGTATVPPYCTTFNVMPSDLFLLLST